MVCIVCGREAAAAIPGFYVVIAAWAMVSIYRQKDDHLPRHVLLLAGLFLPFAFQTMLGGLQASGMMMLWSLPTLVAAVNLQRGGIRYLYLATTGIMPGGAMTLGIPGQWLLAFNLATIMPANFILADLMLRAQRRLRKRVFAMQRESHERFVNAMEERNRELQKSLDHAARIQMALWPDRSRLCGLFEEMNVMYLPKESVGGDLVWHARVEDRSYFSVLDCTGHGVPGSLMSMLIHGLLNEVVHSDPRVSAADVVRRTQQMLNDRLDRGRTGNTDGAEMALLCFDHSKRRVTCCSYGCGIIVQEGAHALHLRSHSGNASIMNGARLAELCEHELSISPATRIFIYTDGLADQFCRNDRKKFSRARIEATLLESGHLSLDAQLARFERTFENWRGGTPLVDDVLLVSVIPHACWRTISLGNSSEAAA
jgi:serine phosphatase RsbU (regulator of sigma subunit)